MNILPCPRRRSHYHLFRDQSHQEEGHGSTDYLPQIRMSGPNLIILIECDGLLFTPGDPSGGTTSVGITSGHAEVVEVEGPTPARWPSSIRGANA